MSDPFAEKPVPWYQRVVRKDRTTYAPKRVARTVGFVSGLAIYLLPAHHSLVLTVVAAVIMAVPAVVLEASYKRRHRRESEQLFVLPESPPVRATVVDR